METDTFSSCPNDPFYRTQVSSFLQNPSLSPFEISISKLLGMSSIEIFGLFFTMVSKASSSISDIRLVDRFG